VALTGIGPYWIGLDSYSPGKITITGILKQQNELISILFTSAPYIYFMNRYRAIFCCLFLAGQIHSQPPSFTVVPLGVKGGLDESNLSSYLVARAGTTNYIALDAGTLYSGIRKAIERGVLPGPGSMVLR
jgi:hypothetical protein